MRFCSTNKVCYNSREMAEEALIHHRAKNNYTHDQGPVNVYKCNICECYHFTSKGESSKVITQDKDRVERLREANYWENKLK